MYPRRLIPRCRECVNYDLRAANGTTNPTYRWLFLNLTMGLCRDFMWRFMVADAIDFLFHFGSWWTAKPPTWMISSFPPGLSRSMSNNYGLSSSKFRGTGT
jgi:hypothetical protein